jgi:hypothetical protein
LLTVALNTITSKSNYNTIMDMMAPWIVFVTNYI